MSSEVKKWLNRGGLIGLMVSAAVYLIGGGTLDGATGTVTLVFAGVGGLLVFVREILGLFGGSK